MEKRCSCIDLAWLKSDHMLLPILHRLYIGKMQIGLEKLNSKSISYTRKLGWPFRTPYADIFAYRVLIVHPSFLVKHISIVS